VSAFCVGDGCGEAKLAVRCWLLRGGDGLFDCGLKLF
jgi:hypothetical protein